MSDNKINCICIGFNSTADVNACSSIDYSQVELPTEVLDSFAAAVASEIKSFYDSDKGKDYFNKWLEQHPQYA